jgi:hypothetical protein
MLTSLDFAVLAFRRRHQPRLAIVLGRVPALVAHARLPRKVGETLYVSYGVRLIGHMLA